MRQARALSKRAVPFVLATFAASAFLCACEQTDSQPERWTVAATPDVEIGMVEGEDAYLFQDIASARFLPDGRIVVADAGYLDVRIFGRDGSFQRRMGGEGSGPGEFQQMGNLWLTSDGRIAVWDPGSLRITTFTPDGELHGTASVSGNSTVGTKLDVYLGSFSNDDVVLASLGFGEDAAEATPDRLRLGRFGLDGAFRGGLGGARGMWRFARNPVAFSPLPYVFVYGDSLYIADGYEPEIAVRDTGGRSIRTVHLPYTAASPSNETWTSLEAELTSRGRPLFLQLLEDRSRPRDSRLPAIAGLLADDRGLIWAKRYASIFESIWLRKRTLRPAPGGEWRVLRPDGRIVAEVRMPENITPLLIERDRVLGVAVDEQDIERIVVHRLNR